MWHSLTYCKAWLHGSFEQAVAVFTCAGSLCSGAEFVVPNGLLNVEGNSYDPFTFRSQPVRYQQVCHASQFSVLPPGGAFLTRLYFRANCGSGAATLVTNFQIRLSTTTRAPDNLSTNFAENIGPDETVVLSTNQCYPPGGFVINCPCYFEEFEAMQAPFFYDPAKGNLLVELRTPAMQYPIYRLDAQDVVGDSVSCIAAYSLEATTATDARTTGVIMLFRSDPAPRLKMLQETNAVVLHYSWYPTGMRLQWSSVIRTNDVWADYPYPVEHGLYVPGEGFYRALAITNYGAEPSRFFRLFWQKPGTLSPSPAGAAPQPITKHPDNYEPP